MSAPLPPGQTAKKEKPPLHEFGEKQSTTTLLSHVGISTANHSGLHTLDDGVVLMASGNLVLFVNYKTGEITSMQGPLDGGVGAVCAHPSRNRFVVCEKNFNGPRVAVYDYPSKQETHVMKNGAQQGYSACSFNSTGKLLATVATEPDYTLTVWNWEQQAIVLRNKAFSSDVYSVMFSPFSESMLITSGLGHLKLWDMASTFTGLKLQGTVGKFGKVEISDISGYVAFPDGKVVSGSESGSLLLWEANLVKCELMRIMDADTGDQTADATTAESANTNGGDSEDNNNNSNDAGDDNSHNSTLKQTNAAANGDEDPFANVKLSYCHQGNVEVVKLIEDNKVVMTAGHDGYVRYWALADIDHCEPSGFSHIVGIKMLKELFLGEGVKAKSVSLSADRTHWVLLDLGGSIRTFPRWSYTYLTSPASAPPPPEQPSAALLEFFSGAISTIVASQDDRTVVVGGCDGTIRLFDTVSKIELYRAAFDDGVTHLQFIPQTVTNSNGLFFCGFANGSVRIIRKCQDGFEVVAAWRPHAAKLVGIALSADTTQVYTAAADGTAFYTRLAITPAASLNGAVSVVVEPFGWCTIPDKLAPTCLEWSSEGDVCFFGFANGMMLAVQPPLAKPNHDETFEFPISYAGVGYRQKKKPPQKEKKVVINPNDHEESSSDEEDEDEDQGPWAINAIKRLPAAAINTTKTPLPIGGYVIAMDKEELAYTYSLTIRYQDKLGPPPIPPTGVDPPGRVEEPGVNVAFRGNLPVGVAVSNDEKTLLTTFSHGEVAIRPLSVLGNTKAPVNHARQYHDSVEGKVNGMAMLYDNSALITVGSDGLIVTHSIDNVQPPSADNGAAAKAALAKLPRCDPKLKQGTNAKLSELPHSVEERRRLDDKAAAEALAEGKRSIIKKKIASVHRDYLQLLEANDNAIGGQKLSEEELVLDPELLRLLDLEKQNRVEEASVEFSWRIAYKEQLLKQLKAAFVDTMVYDRFAVNSFEKTFTVNSIRTPAFTPEQKQKLELLQAAIQQNLGLRPSANGDGGFVGIDLNDAAQAGENPTEGADNNGGEGQLALNGGATGGSDPSGEGDDKDMGPSYNEANNTNHEQQSQMHNTTLNTTAMTDTLGKNKSLKSQLEKAEERKRERLERKRGLEELLARKPKPTDVDPVVEAEIRYAREHMGAKILKTAPEYRVPTNLIPTAERKAKQLILLEHSINTLRAAFNEKLLQLRDLKRSTCVELNADRQRLAEIIATLGTDERELPSAFELLPCEEPEKRFEINEQNLRRWAKEKAKEQRRLEAQQRAGRGFGSDLAGGEDGKDGDGSDSDDEAPLAGDKRQSRLSGGHRESTFVRKPSLLSLKEKLEMDLKTRLENVRLGELEEEEAIIQRETLMYEKGRLIRRMEAAKKSYDEKLLEFLQERMRLEADLCMADMRALLLFREFRMLLNFKKKDEELEEKRSAKLAEQQRINQRIKAITNDIAAAKVRQDQIRQAAIATDEEADMLIKTAFPAQDQPYLNRVYKRKIKRVKATDENDDDDDAPTSSEDEEEEASEDSFVEARPATCDESPWLQLLQLRELRLDAEDDQDDLKHKADDFEKALRKVTEKEKAKVEKELAECRQAVENFQLEKQRQLNLLDTIVVLKLSQIQCLDDSRKVPSDLQKAPVIVFTESAINGLRSRIAELAEEKQDLARKSEQLARAKQALLRRKSKRQLEHAEWEQRVSEVQLLKFGQKVDLEALENLAVDRETEELKQQLKLEEIKWERELRRQDTRVKNLRHDHQSRIGENTMLLKDLGNIREEQQVLEHALTTSTQKIVGKMAGGSKVATAADRAQLKDLVVRQQQELDMLQNEITMLKRKGGHVYTPVIQRLQQQNPGHEAFTTSQPAVPMSSSMTNGGAPQHMSTYPQHPSSAPSSQQVGQQQGNGHKPNNLAASTNATAGLVVRPSTLATASARQPPPVARGKRAVGSPLSASSASPPSPAGPPEGLTGVNHGATASTPGAAAAPAAE